MRYHWFRKCGLFTSSGVEAGRKTVIGQRLILSGMHWTTAGADASTTLCCHQASRPDDQIWRTLHTCTASELGAWSLSCDLAWRSG